jgi:hypothetical protein
MKRILIIFLIFNFHYNYVFSQCCGGHSPIGGNTNQGTLPKYTLQINSFYKHAYSAGYMENDHNSDFKFVENANNNFLGLQVGYGITKRFTAEIEAGYYLNRTQNFKLNDTKYILEGKGGSSATFTGRYNIYKDSIKDFEFTMGLGVRLPWSKIPQVIDGVELAQDVQPSNGGYGLSLQSFLFKEFDDAEINIFMINALIINTENTKKYKEGNSLITGLFFSKAFKKVSAIAQVRNELRAYAYRYGLRVNSSGGYRLLIVPQISYTVKQKYNLAFLYELPIYQYYNGIQIRDRYAFSVNLNIRLGLSKKANQLCEK